MFFPGMQSRLAIIFQDVHLPLLPVYHLNAISSSEFNFYQFIAPPLYESLTLTISCPNRNRNRGNAPTFARVRLFAQQPLEDLHSHSFTRIVLSTPSSIPADRPSHTFKTPTFLPMEPLRFDIRMRCGHRTNEDCLPPGYKSDRNGGCPALCLPCDRAQLCQTESHARRQLARLDTLKRYFLPLQDTANSPSVSSQLQLFATSKNVIKLKIAEAREQFRQRWYTQTQRTSSNFERSFTPERQALILGRRRSI
jgi:hypothetical protein